MAIKGFFWGNKQFLAPALFEIIEEIFTVILGVLLLTGAQSLTPLEGATKAAWAHTLAGVLVCALACITLLYKKPKWCTPTPFVKPLAIAAAPITAVRSGATLVNAAIAVLLPAMLTRAGMPQGDALQAFGVATGMVLPLIGIPLTVIGSLSIVLVPELAEDHQKRNLRRLQTNVERGLFFAVALACLLVPLFIAVGYPLAALTYQNDLAGEMLPRVAFLLLPMSFGAVIVSILNSLGFEKHTFAVSLVGSAIFILCILFLPALVGIYAYPIGLFLHLAIEGIYCLILLKKHCPLSRKFYQKSALCLGLTLPLGMLGRWILRVCLQGLGEWPSTLCAAALLSVCTVVVYALFKLFPAAKIRKKTPPTLDNQAVF